MLGIIAAVLMVLWLIGFFTFHVTTAFIGEKRDRREADSSRKPHDVEAAVRGNRMETAASRERRLVPNDSLSGDFKGRNKMNGISFKLPRLLLPLGLLSFGVSLLATPILWYQEVQQGPDSTKKSKHQTTPTADQQQMTPADRALTQKIRKAIHRDKGLSTYGRNIKIFMQDGKITLRGLVRSEQEKDNLQAKAAAAGGEENVTNQLEIAPSK
jgi:hyperosmotically inducible periplasmic protein